MPCDITIVADSVHHRAVCAFDPFYMADPTITGCDWKRSIFSKNILLGPRAHLCARKIKYTWSKTSILSLNIVRRKQLRPIGWHMGLQGHCRGRPCPIAARGFGRVDLARSVGLSQGTPRPPFGWPLTGSVGPAEWRSTVKLDVNIQRLAQWRHEIASGRNLDGSGTASCMRWGET